MIAVRDFFQSGGPSWKRGTFEWMIRLFPRWYVIRSLQSTQPLQEIDALMQILAPLLGVIRRNSLSADSSNGGFFGTLRSHKWVPNNYLQLSPTIHNERDASCLRKIDPGNDDLSGSGSFSAILRFVFCWILLLGIGIGTPKLTAGI